MRVYKNKHIYIYIYVYEQILTTFLRTKISKIIAKGQYLVTNLMFVSERKKQNHLFYSNKKATI